MANAHKRDLVGRTITAVEWNRFATRCTEAPRSTNPVLHLDNGSILRFIVQETEVGEYGVEIIVHKKKELRA